MAFLHEAQRAVKSDGPGVLGKHPKLYFLECGVFTGPVEQDRDERSPQSLVAPFLSN